MTYEAIRLQYLPKMVRVLLVAESPPPAATISSSRHFYRTDTLRVGDRLFTNTIRALYQEAEQQTEQQLQCNKEQWLRRLQEDGYYMIEALTTSQEHEVTKKQRQARIAENLPHLLERIANIADKKTTNIILIKSNVFEVAAEPLRTAGWRVLNTELVDYPGQYNQGAYRQKLRNLIKLI